ncbi:hypothetical protein [Bradyrhizobium sp. LHD-71]|uniref:hypothetical protein n=1 Tax=Bradyrhizobium sp. LHD-71 TaxID=3072141 RepID=UPI00280C68D0|nr:hypothetical protein [Bradyrhizobium sp. LHD-71]MDQ8728054.1 hypothetical protein [Bradyrhizobium sp. LHD-71]
MGSVYIDSKITDEERRSRLYAGDIFICSPTEGTRALIDLARQMLEEAFAPHDPRTIHKWKTPEEVAAILGKLKPQFIHHPECKQIIPQIMREHGVDLESLYFDVPRLRSAYPSHFLSSGIAYAFHPHRDTWYSAPMCQLNWWLPIYPIEPDNSLGFYPRYFEEAVKNNSEIYNYYEWNTNNRATAAQHVRSDTREQPKAQQELEPVTVRLLPPPGGTIIFSGAQMHETVPNTTNAARYSIDFRTVHYDDVLAHRGAPNVDSRSTGTTMRDYLRASDLTHLPEEAIALYDDETAKGERVLYFGDKLLQETHAGNGATGPGASHSPA